MTTYHDFEGLLLQVEAQELDAYDQTAEDDTDDDKDHAELANAGLECGLGGVVLLAGSGGRCASISLRVAHQAEYHFGRYRRRPQLGRELFFHFRAFFTTKSRSLPVDWGTLGAQSVHLKTIRYV